MSHFLRDLQADASGSTSTRSSPVDRTTSEQLPSQSQTKLRGRQRLLQNLQRISSSPSLARISRISCASTVGGSSRGSMSCVSLSANHSSPVIFSTPRHVHQTSYSSTASSVMDATPFQSAMPTPAIETTFHDDCKNKRVMRLPGGANAVTNASRPTARLPDDLRALSRRADPSITPEASEVADRSGDYFFIPTRVVDRVPTPPPRPLVDQWGRLSAELQIDILRHLPARDLVRCGAVNQSWRRVCMDGQLWQTFDAADFYRVIPGDRLTTILATAGAFVKDLNLRGCLQMQVERHARILSDACHNVERLTLEGSHADRDSISAFLTRNHRLVHLNLSGLKGVTNSTCRDLGQHCPQLESLNLNWCYNMNARGLVRIIEGCPRLMDLRVNECRGLTDPAILDLLFTTNRLERLLLHACADIRDEHLRILFEGLDPEICPLTRRALVPPRQLRHLDISKIPHLTDVGLRSLVGNVPHLQGLQLGGNAHLTDDALSALLPTIPQLTHLDLEELPGLTNETAKRIASGPAHMHLHHLTVSYCERLGDTGMLPLIRACRSLRNLEMDNTRISDLCLAEAADVVRSRKSRSSLDNTSTTTTKATTPHVGLRLVVYDCPHVTWTGIREVLAQNAEVRRPTPTGWTSPTHPTEIIQLKCFYGWQMTVDEHSKRVLRGDLAAAGRLARRWGEYMMATEEAGTPGAGGRRRRRRRAREAAMLHADEEEAGLVVQVGAGVGAGRRRRARSGGCLVM